MYFVESVSDKNKIRVLMEDPPLWGQQDNKVCLQIWYIFQTNMVCLSVCKGLFDKEISQLGEVEGEFFPLEEVHCLKILIQAEKDC